MAEPLLPPGARLVKTAAAAGRSWGLADEDFRQRRPWRGQITKREVRAVSLYQLGLRPDSVVWDIGAGSGSISVEAAVIAHQGSVYAIERDREGLPLLEDNVARYSPGNVIIVDGEAPGVLYRLPGPDSVFIGGGGARLPEILDAVEPMLRPGGKVVVNLAVMERASQTYRRLQALGFTAALTMVSAARGREMTGGALRLESLNPVFVVSGWPAGQPGED